MKSIFILIILFSSTLVFSEVQNSIQNFQVVLKDTNNQPFIFRGSQLYRKSHFDQLKNLDIEKVIIFKIEKNQEVFNEVQKLAETGLTFKNIIHIPMKWKDFESFEESCLMTKKALVELKNSYDEHIKTYFHCSAGEDRTGYLDGLFQTLIFDHSDVETVFQKRLCQFGYAHANVKKPLHVSEALQSELSLHYVVMTKKIMDLKSENKSIQNLDCSTDEENIKKIKPFVCQ